MNYNSDVPSKKTAENPLQMLLRGLPDAYLFLSPDLSIIAASTFYLKAIGKTEKEVLNKNVLDISPKGVNASANSNELNLKDSLNQILKSKEPHMMGRLRVSLPRPTSLKGEAEPHYWEIKNIPVLNGNNEILYIIHKVTEVPGPEVQQEVKSMEGMLRNVLDNSSLGIMAYTATRRTTNEIADFVCIMANLHSENFTGIPASEAVGKNISEIWASYNPKEIINTCAKLVETGNTLAYEQSYKKDGTTKWLYAVSSKLDDGFTISFLEISERKSAEAKFLESNKFKESLINNNINGIVALDKELNYTEWNPFMEKFLGIKKESVIGRNLFEVFPDSKGSEDVNAFIRALNGEKTLIKDKPYLTNPGFYESYISPIYNASNEITGVVAILHDITERKKNEQDLLQSKQKFEAIFNQTSYYVSVLSVEGKIIDSNDAALGMRGISLDYVRGMNFWELAPWRNNRQVENAIKEAAHGKFVRYEVDLIGRDENIISVDFSLTPILDEEKKVIFLIAEGRDITTRKKAEEELRNSQSLLSEAEKIAHYGSWEWDIKENSIVWSDELYRIYGYEPREIQVTYETFIKHIPTTDSERVNSLINASLNTMEPFSFNHPIVQKNGALRYLSGMGKVIAGEDGQPLKMMGTTLDVTEQKEINKEILKSEGLYRALAKNMPNAVVLLYDKNLKITLADGGAMDALEFPGDVIIGMNIREVYNHENDLPLVELFDKSLEGEESTYERELNGKVYKMEIMPVKNSIGEIFAGMSVSQDVTEIKQYQRELEIRIDRLNRSNEELEQFAYVASHDLQEPLRKIRAFGERLSGKFKNELGDDGKDFIDRMQNAASRMQILIDDLLAYSKLSRSKEQYVKVDLSEIVKEVLNDLEITVEQKKAIINCDAICSVMAIEGQMRQLFQNLISNALKFNKPNQIPVVNIKSEIITGKDIKGISKVFRKSKFCRISIQDSGIGFEEKFLDRIFVIFQRLHGRSEYAGTGIGLAICKKIVEHHNGFITAESKPNEGAKFIITLPLNALNDEQAVLPL